jgi:hypothetical protein
MSLKIPALFMAVGALGIIGVSTPAPAQSGTAAPSRQGVANPTTAPTVSPGSETAQNPLVNPSAAGTQRGWKGYGSASNATAAHPMGSDDTGTRPGPTAGKVTPGAGQPYTAPSVSPKATGAHTAAEARQRLKRLGYDRVANVHKLHGSQWQATALKNNRKVKVVLDAKGNVVSEH